MDGEEAQTSTDVPHGEPKPDVATPMEEDAPSQDPSTAVEAATHSTADGAEKISSDSVSERTPPAALDKALEKPLGTDVESDCISEGTTPSSFDKPLKESSRGDGSSVSVVTTTPNVVVEKVGGGLMTWNLTAAGGDGDGEVISLPIISPDHAQMYTNEGFSEMESSTWGKETGSVFPLDLGGASTILTQDQILKIDAALKSEQIKAGPNPLLQIPHQDSMESMEEPDDHQEEAEEKMQLNIDSVLNIGHGSFNTKLLMNQVMSSEILMEAIGDDGLVAAATVVKTTSDDESDSGSTTDSTSDKKREDNLKRRSARIAHITANDLTLRQAIREKEQKKKEREEKKRQKEEEQKVKDSNNVTVVEGESDTPTAPEQVTPKEEEKGGTDLSSEIAKYLMVIDQEIKQTEDQENPDQKQADPAVKNEDPVVEKDDPAENKESSSVQKEEVKDQEDVKVERKRTSSNLFDVLGKDKTKKEVQEENVKERESTAGEKEKKIPDETAKRTSDNGKSKNADNHEEKCEVKEKTLGAHDDMELGEVKEEKETGELSDEDEAHHDPNSSVYWMDHSYAASPKVTTASSVPVEPHVDSPTKRNTRRASRKAKSAEEKTEEERPRRSSRRESKVSKEEENKEAKPDIKSKSKHDRKDKKASKEKKEKDKDDSRSRSKEKVSSKEEKNRRESRSKSVDDKNKDKKKKKHKEKDKEKDESKKKKSSRSSREIKKPKHGNDELSDIPFSSEEEHDPDEDEHDSGGSDWTSDDDPEKLWCICRQPHDGKFMICCDKCEDWFHGKCVNITKKEGKRMEQVNQSWMCPKCTDDEKNGVADKAKEEKIKKTEDLKDAPSKEKERRKSRDRKRADEEDDEEEEEEEGGTRKRRGKVTDEKKRKRKSDAGTRKDSESKKQPEEEVVSKKKRLKFFRPPPPKQHCIGTRCDNWARSGSVYCSPGCIVKHAKESMRLLSAEKERATGLKARRDSTGGMPSSSTKSLKLREDERISVIERHTGRLRTGLTAPTYEELPYWLGRHPTYEVLRPNIKHGYTTSTVYSGKGSSKQKPDSSRRLSHEGDPSKNISSSDSERKISTKQITSPNKDSGAIGADSLERRQRERREKVRKLLEMKRREEEAIERELERKRMEENRRKREEEKREEEEKKKKEEEKRKKEDRDRREREKREKEERSRQQAESSKLAEQTSESVRVNVKRTLLDVLLTRVKKAPDVKNVTADDVKKVSKQIEFELYKLFNDTGAKYKAKYRTLIFNIKDLKNKGLFRHILKGEISPRNLVRMSSDQLASKELMKWREQEAKHELDMIVQTEEDKKGMHVTIVKKTHKGEVELGEEDNLGELVPHTKAEEEASKQSNRSPTISEELKSPTRLSFGSPTSHHGGSSPTTPTSPTTPKTLLIDTTEQHKAHLFDLNCKICTGKIPAPKEDKVSKKKAIVRKRVIKKVMEEKKRGGIVKEKPVKFFGEEIEEKKSRPKSVTEDLYDDLMETVGGGIEDEDDDDDDAALIFGKPVDEARTPPGSPPPPVVPAPKPAKEKKASRPSQVKRSTSSTVMTSSPAWRGFIFMHEVSKFVAVAHHVSGPAQSIPMDLQDTLEVCGRIPYRIVWDYFTKLKQSQSTEMTVMRFHVWQEDEEAAYFALFDYFYTRQRIGVIGKNRPHVKDFYLIALPSSDKVPHHILPFNGPGLPSNRPHMLLGIVVRHKDKQRSMSLDGELASKPISQPPREPPVQHVPKRKHHQPVEDITPPENPMSSFRSGLPNILEMSDLITPKDVPMKTKEMYVTEDQLVDPIVAQYANADPKDLEAELEEPYSPTREERNAPYDPSDPTDDWIQGRSMPTSAVIPEPALPQAPPVITPEAKEVVNPLIKTDGEMASAVKATDIASVAADASQDLLSAFSEQSGLSEQQQLLIQLTKQVEEAKKALLDRQIESLQSEINKATGKIGKNDKQSSDEAGTSPDIRLAQADSSTMTPKDDATSTPVRHGGDALQEASVDVQPLCPPPNLPPFAVGAVLWNAANSETIAQKQSPTMNQQQLPVTRAREGKVGIVGTGNAASSISQTWNQDFHHPPPLMQSEQLPPPPLLHSEHLLPKDLPRHSDPSYSHTKPHSSQPTPLPHSSAHLHEPPHHHRPSPPPHGQPSAPFQSPPIPQPPHHHRPSPPPHGQPPAPFQSPPIPQLPPIPRQPLLPRQPILPHHPPVPRQPLLLHHPAPETAAPSVPVTKKRKLEPPPPGEEGWKYGDEDGQSEGREDLGPIGQRRIDQRSASDRHPRRDIDYRRNVNIQKSDDHFEDVEQRRHWEDDKPREPWAREHWDHERRGEREWGPKGDRGRGRGGGFEDWSSRDYPDREDSFQVDYQHRSKEQLLKDPRMGCESPISRDYGHRGQPR